MRAFRKVLDRRFVKHFIDPFGRNQGRLDGGIFFGQVIDGVEKLFDVIGKGVKDADLQRASADAAVAVPDQKGNDQAVHDLHDRPQKGVQKDLHHGPVIIFLVQVSEFFQLVGLTVEGLNDLHAGNIFGEKTVDAADQLFDLLEIALDDPLKMIGTPIMATRASCQSMINMTTMMPASKKTSLNRFRKTSE